MAPCIRSTLGNHLKTNLNEKYSGLEKVNSLSLATILDPRFRQAGFTNQSNAEAADTRVCQSYTAEDVPLETATSASAGEENYNCGLYWTTMQSFSTVPAVLQWRFTGMHASMLITVELVISGFIQSFIVLLSVL